MSVLLRMILCCLCVMGFLHGGAGAAVSQSDANREVSTGSMPQQANDYVLGPRDKVRIIVFGEESLSGEFFISGNGKVSLPLIGDVDAAGLTVGALQQKIQDTLRGGYLRDPRVSAEILNFRPFYILGEVTKPGEYPYNNGLTLLSAVATAGGFTYRANTKKVFIKGARDNSERAVTVTSTTTVSPGDTIRVPERFF